ncbi:Fluoroacetate dehalogenase [Cytospora mali]|uniref:Fluoroacetate dehalogenase n=1 Tax=Cytospora mali TaxID=578113 RepID=A0A194UMB5_CYTMA|nr:Fluoroacetate dehalogenase [Valsa mali var. pyri (nom. inval.)]
MFEGFEPIAIKTSSEPEVIISGLKSKSNNPNKDLPPLLLLHGFPQTLHIWHRVTPHLTDTYNIVLLDLRGYGASSKPVDVTSYAKSAMARDCVAVMDQLGHESFYICAHDRGARVGHKLCVDYPDRVKKAIFLDICPTLVMYESTDFEFAKAYFHWFLLIQPDPLPETMILGNPRRVAEMFMGGRQAGGLSIFEKECFEAYVGSLCDPATVHAMCQDYRASATLDMEEQRKDLDEGRNIKCPLRVLWGKHGVIEKRFDAVAEWEKVTEKDVEVDGYAVDSGHYVPEQAPDQVISAIRDFLL